jgi:hypothetical protein
MANHVSPTNDLAFKKTFTEECNKDVLHGLICDFFDFQPALTLDDISITSPYNIKAYEEDLRRVKDNEEINEETRETLRQTIHDITADIKSAGFGAELQIRKGIYFSARSIYLACSRFCANYNVPGKIIYGSDGKPIRYSSLKPVYMLNILGYGHFQEDDDALRVFTLYDSKRLKAFEREYITIAYFELMKDNIETPNQKHWRAFFRTGKAADNAPEYIKKAARVIDKVNFTQEERDMINYYELAEDIRADENYAAELEGEARGITIGEARGITIGEARGITIGEARGEYMKAIAIARELLARNVPVNEIIEITGLTADDVRKLIQ